MIIFYRFRLAVTFRTLFYFRLSIKLLFTSKHLCKAFRAKLHALVQKAGVISQLQVLLV